MTKQEEIARLKAEKGAAILAHYYVEPEVQAVADYVGDSFYLSKLAQGLDVPVIVYCGVGFMGESGKLLSPHKTVLMPDAQADCPMAHMVRREDVERYRAEYPELAVVCYINSTMEIKSWADVCVTSANAVQVVRKLPNHDILFIPDKNLGRHVAELVPEKNVMVLDGFCPIHDSIRAEELAALKKAHPAAELLVHPECSAEVRAMADYLGSTSGIVKYAAESQGREFIIGTEVGVRYALEQKAPGKTFYFPETAPICADMKRITLDKVIDVLKTGKNAAAVSEDTKAQAALTLERMLELAR